MKPDYHRAADILLRQGCLTRSALRDCGIKSHGANCYMKLQELATILAFGYLAKVPARQGEHRREFR